MNTLTVVAIVSVVFLLIIIIEKATKKTGIPLNVFLVLAGFLGSELLLLFVDDLGIRWFHIRDVMLYLLLPVILFQTLFKLDFHIDRKDLWIMLALAFPMTLMTGLSIGLLLYLLIGHPENFPLHTAMVGGMLLASTSSTAMGFVLKAAKAPERLTNIMMGEGLFNSPIAIMLFFFLLPLDNNAMTDGALLLDASKTFLWQVGLSVLDGIVIGWLLIHIMRWVDGGFRHLVITQVGCFLSYYIANGLLGISGVASLLPTALIMVFYMQKHQSRADFKFAQIAWDSKRYLASGGLHVLMGISLTVALFTYQWTSMLLGVFVALLIRAIIVFLLLPLFSQWFATVKLHYAHNTVLWWGGMRGGTTIVLALSLPETLPGWWTVQAIGYGAVLFSLSFQAGFLPFFVDRVNRLKPIHS